MVLILGILSVCCSWWHFVSLAGIILGICALVLAIKVTRSYRRNPAVYNLNSLNNVKTGRLCAMLGLAISTIVFVSVVLSATGVLSKLPYWGMIH